MRMIERVDEGKQAYLPLLLLADEQEDMIERYLDRGALYVLRENDMVLAVCVVTEEGGGIFEVKNLAVAPEHQRKGLGRAMLDFVQVRYRGCGRFLQVGTGESPLTVPFYQRCGFVYSHRIPDFFTQYYDHPIAEAGVRLEDMVYFRRPL